MVALLKLLETLCASALQISKSVVEWEQGELAGNILSLIESSDSDEVLNQGLKVFIAMQESSLLLGEEFSSRLNDINGQ